MEESDLGTRRTQDGAPLRIISGWEGNYLIEMTNKENARAEYARGCLLPNARWSGISTDCDEQMRWEGGVIETEDIQKGYARLRQGPRNRNGNIQTKLAVPQHQRARWTRSRDMRAAHRENPTLILPKEEWGVPPRRYYIVRLQAIPIANGADAGVSEENHVG